MSSDHQFDGINFLAGTNGDDKSQSNQQQPQFVDMYQSAPSLEPMMFRYIQENNMQQQPQLHPQHHPQHIEELMNNNNLNLGMINGMGMNTIQGSNNRIPVGQVNINGMNGMNMPMNDLNMNQMHSMGMTNSPSTTSANVLNGYFPPNVSDDSAFDERQKQAFEYQRMLQLKMQQQQLQQGQFQPQDIQQHHLQQQQQHHQPQPPPPPPPQQQQQQQHLQLQPQQYHQIPSQYLQPPRDWQPGQQNMSMPNYNLNNAALPVHSLQRTPLDFMISESAEKQVKSDIQRYNELVRNQRLQLQNEGKKVESKLTAARANFNEPENNSKVMKAKASVPAGAFAPKNFKKKKEADEKSASPVPIPAKVPNDNDSEIDLKSEEIFNKKLETLPNDLNSSNAGSNDLRVFIINNIKEFGSSSQNQEVLMNRLASILTCFEKILWGKDPDWRFVALTYIMELMKVISKVNESSGVKAGINFKIKFAKKNKLFNRISNWLRFDISNHKYSNLITTLEFLKKVSLSKISLENHKMITPLKKLQALEGQKQINSLASDILGVTNAKLSTSSKSASVVKSGESKKSSDTAKSTVKKVVSAKSSMLFNKSTPGKISKPEKKVLKRPQLANLLPDSTTSAASSDSKSPTESKARIGHSHSAATVGSPDSDIVVVNSNSKPASPTNEKFAAVPEIIEVNEPPKVNSDGVKSILRRENDQAKTKRKRRQVSLKWKDEVTNSDNLTDVKFFEFDPEERKLDLNSVVDMYEKVVPRKRGKIIVPNSGGFNFVPKAYEGPDQGHHMYPHLPPTPNLPATPVMKEKDTVMKDVSSLPPPPIPKPVPVSVPEFHDPEEDKKVSWYSPAEFDFKSIPWFEYSEDNSETRGGGEVKVESEEAQIQKDREAITEPVKDPNQQIQEPLDGGVSGMRPNGTNGLVLNAKTLNPFGVS